MIVPCAVIVKLCLGIELSACIKELLIDTRRRTRIGITPIQESRLAVGRVMISLDSRRRAIIRCRNVEIGIMRVIVRRSRTAAAVIQPRGQCVDVVRVPDELERRRNEESDNPRRP